MNPAGGGNSPAGAPGGPRPGHTSCWLCGQPIEDPPDIIGHWHATRARVAHRHCLRVLGELDLNLPFPTRP